MAQERRLLGLNQSEHNMKLAQWIGAIISLSSAAIGCVMWLTTIYNQGTASASDIKEIKSRQDKYLDDISGIKADIGKIKGKLEIE